MTKYQEYAAKPRAFLAITGYTRAEFDALLPPFRIAVLCPDAHAAAEWATLW